MRGEESRTVKGKRQLTDRPQAGSRLQCPGQSYEITREMCDARRAGGFGKCSKCRVAAALAKSA